MVLESREDLADVLSRYLATNPYRCVTFGMTVDLVHNSEGIPAFAEWMARIVSEAEEWGAKNA